MIITKKLDNCGKSDKKGRKRDNEKTSCTPAQVSDFFKEKRVSSRRERGRYTVRSRAVARRYPTE